VVATIRRIWIDLLGVPEVGDDDDFFEVGGHSLIAIRLMSRIHKELGVRFQLATIFDAATIADQAAKVLEVNPGLDDELAARSAAATATATVRDSVVDVASTPASESSGHQSLVPITSSGEEAPLFIVHGAGGNVLFLWSLARALAGRRPVYGFQAHGVDGTDMPDPTIEAMATRYVAELRAAHRGPYIVGGYSGGGIVAFEMVRQLQALGEEVDQLILFDTPLPGEAEPSRSSQLGNFAANARRYGFSSVKPYVRWRVANAVHRFVPRRAGRDDQVDHAARQIGAIDVEQSGFVNLFYYFSAAAERYQMTQVEVNAAIIKADRIWPVRAYDYHWHRYIGGRLDIAETPGDHWAMFFPENVPYLAEVLTELLEQHGS
jgi:thioesterase domain-containing protein/acyl carrier protein